MEDPCKQCVVQPCCTKDCKDRVFYIMGDEMKKLLKEFKESGTQLPAIECTVTDENQIITDSKAKPEIHSVFDAVLKSRMKDSDRLKEE